MNTARCEDKKLHVWSCWACDKQEPAKVCSGCNCARYCDLCCQKSDWKRHRLLCRPSGIIKESQQEIIKATDKSFVEQTLLAYLDSQDIINSSAEFALRFNFEHEIVLDVLKSLSCDELVVTQSNRTQLWILSEEAKGVVENGSSEVRLFNAVPEDGIVMNELKDSFGDTDFKHGFRATMKNGWLCYDKISGILSRKVDVGQVTDEIQLQLLKVLDNPNQDEVSVDAKTLKKLKTRKLISLGAKTMFSAKKGSCFALSRQKMPADITEEMLKNGEWKTRQFKPYNLHALGRPLNGGYLHPLMKVKSQFRQILLEMGFEEMPTNNYVESSFWNFDALFQPQQHPARDAHDTFFLLSPSKTLSLPNEYANRVKTMHEEGGNGSIGWRYAWKLAEAEKNIMRTHTTAVSARVLHELAKQPVFQPKRYFSIDRVFRNEHVDASHLAEFYQVEGFVVDRNLTLGDLIGTISAFFDRYGIKNVRFKPAYNPYTEPSMEIFAYSPELGTLMEIGNSGIFRPEMLLPMGLPPDVSVLAWGLGLERPTMIKYGIKNIRELFGHKVDLDMVQHNAICMFE